LANISRNKNDTTREEQRGKSKKEQKEKTIKKINIFTKRQQQQKEKN